MLTRRDLALGLLLASVSRRLAAQPALTQHIGPTVETDGSTHYAFDHFRLDSVDRQRRYRIVIGTPRRKPPAGGYPAIYLLDGNAALMAIDDSLLAEVVQADCPPVLAFVCYDNDLRIDATARAYDYTPARQDDGAEEWDIPGRRRSGGAAAFLTLLSGAIRAGILEKAPVNPGRQTLWGHSYGGLFALHALCTRPQSFTRYVAVDPSLWWGEGFALEQARRFAAAKPALSSVTLSLMFGTAIRARDTSARRPTRYVMPDGAGKQLAASLATVEGLNVRLQELAGLSHGQTLGASLPLALQEVAQAGNG